MLSIRDNLKLAAWTTVLILAVYGINQLFS